MAFDGIVIANLVRDLKEVASDGRISKIAQPEADEILFTIKKPSGMVRLLLSANASLPLVYLTEKNRKSPATAPNFCMLLRKYIANGKIISITQPEMDRIIRFEIEHFDDMGDIRRKHLYMELMGKHSNLIFCDDNDMIIDSIKHISARVSSLREVLPGRPYFPPVTQEKENPLTADADSFIAQIKAQPKPAYKAIYSAFNGFSPVVATDLCTRAGIDADHPANCLSDAELLALSKAFLALQKDILDGNFAPNILYNGKEPVEFSSVPLCQFPNYRQENFSSISEVLESYYASKEVYSRIRQKSTDLRKIVSTDLERAVRKYDLQCKQLKDTEKREKYRIYGELLNTYGYEAKEGDTALTCLNYYDNEEITIPLDPQLSAKENAQKYFNRYNKLKRTYEALETLTQETKDQITHLESVSNSLDIAVSEADLAQIKEELIASGYIKRKSTGKKAKRQEKSKPFHYRSSDGFDIYVGKNNLQNEDLTFKVANGGDWWFHAKQMPGSHVIVKTNGAPMTDLAYEEAGALAAYYSAGKGSPKVEIDYLQRKNIKKPNGAKPGFVIYYTNYSLTAIPDISHLELLEE